MVVRSNGILPKHQGALMLSSSHLQRGRKTILLLMKYYARDGRSWWLPGLRTAHFAAVAILLFPLTGLLNAQGVVAQPSRSQQRAALSQQQALQKIHNASALMVLSGRPGTTYFDIVHDIATGLNEGDGVRVIAVDAPGGADSLRDLLFLRGVDLALIPANVLDYADTTAAFGPGLPERLTYVTTLYGEEVHVLAGPGVASIQDLAGRKIAVPPDDGNVEFTARDLLRRLHIEAEVVKVAAADAIDEVRSGALAALVLLGGKPLRTVAALPKDGSLHLLAVPSAEGLGDSYSPGSFGADDYPALIAGRQVIDTVSVGAALVANKTGASEESSQRIAKFVPAFFGSLSELSGPRQHPKWGEVNLAASLARWQRFPAAEEWLNAALRKQSASVQRDFDDFLRANSPAGSPPLSPAERKHLFDEYQKWTRSTAESSR